MKNIDRSLAVLLTAAAIAPVAGVIIADTFLSKAIAGSTTKTMAVTATVVSNCNFTGTAGPLAFGSYDPTSTHASDGSDLDVTPTFGIRCTKGVTATLSINLGVNASGAVRRMVRTGDATAFATYEIYTTAGRTTVWNAVNTNSYVSESAATSNQSVYGRMPKGQDTVTAGSDYTDTVTITAAF